MKLSLGGVVAADVKLTGGEVLFEPIHANRRIGSDRGGPRSSDLRRGVGAAGRGGGGGHGDWHAHQFGRTAELVRTAHVVSTQQKAVLRVVRNLAAFKAS